LLKLTKVRSHGNNVHDVIIAHVIRGDEQNNGQTDAENIKQSTTSRWYMKCTAAGWLTIAIVTWVATVDIGVASHFCVDMVLWNKYTAKKDLLVGQLYFSPELQLLTWFYGTILE